MVPPGSPVRDACAVLLISLAFTAALTLAVVGPGGAPVAPVAQPISILSTDGAQRFDLRTRSVQRGGEPVHAFRERVRWIDERSVEQDWTFPERPGGSGALEVEVEVSPEVALAGEDRGGLTFASAAGARLRYGHGTWIDARGRRFHIPARANGSAVSLEVSEAVLQVSEFPAVLDPVVSADFEPGPASVRRSPLDQRAPAAAWDGSQYLVVWADGTSPGPHTVRGVRVDGAGAVLGTASFQIAAAPDCNAPAVAFDGQNFLVVWSRRVTAGGPGDIYAVHVSPAGQVLEAAPLPVAVGANDKDFPAVATLGGGQALVAWVEQRGVGTDLVGVRVSAAGQVLDAAALPLSALSGDEASPALVALGGRWLLVFTHEPGAGATDVRAALVDASGAAAASVLLQAGAQEPRVAVNGGVALAVWNDTGAARDVRGRRLDAAGGLLEPVPIAIGAAPNAQYLPTVVAEGTGFRVAWSDLRTGGSSDLYSARVSGQDGAVLDPSGGVMVFSLGLRIGPALLPGAPMPLLAWSEMGVLSGADVVGSPLLPDAGVLVPGGVVLSSTLSDQQRPSFASDGTRDFVVWADNRNGDYDIYGTRLVDGGVVDPNGIPICTASGDQTEPSIAFDGTTYLVAWTDARAANNLEVYAARVTPGGTVQDVTGFPVSTAAFAADTAPVVASSGGRFLVSWQSVGSTTASVDVVGRRYAAGSGFLESQPFAIAAQAGAQQHAAVAAGTGEYLVSWDDEGGGVRAAPVAPSGSPAVGTSFQIAGPAADGGVPPTWPAVAPAPGGYAVAWRQGAIQVARVSAAGALLEGPMAVSRAPSGGAVPGAPAVSSNGVQLYAAWSEPVGAWRELRGARVELDGGVVDPGGLPVLSGEAPVDGGAPRLRLEADGVYLAYESTHAALGASRVRMAEVSFDPADPGAPCSLSSDCGSGFCVSGVCCATACGAGMCSTGVCLVTGPGGSDGGAGADGGAEEEDAGGAAEIVLVPQAPTLLQVGCSSSTASTPAAVMALLLMALRGCRRRR